MLRRQIGRKFESLRKAAGLTMEQAAERLDRARATLHRIENGAEHVRFRQADVQQMLDLYGASDDDRELLLALTAATRENKNWWHDYIGAGLPRWFQLYIGLEAAASGIRQYEAELVPGLLQTRAYAEQVFKMPGGAIDADDDQEQHRAVQLRVERQTLLTRFSPPRLSVIINEAVLRRPVGNATIMAEQLHQIAKAAELPNATVQVLTFLPDCTRARWPEPSHSWSSPETPMAGRSSRPWHTSTPRPERSTSTSLTRRLPTTRSGLTWRVAL